VLARFGFTRVYHLKFLSFSSLAAYFIRSSARRYIYLSHNGAVSGAFRIPAAQCRTWMGFFYFTASFKGALAYFADGFCGAGCW